MERWASDQQRTTPRSAARCAASGARDLLYRFPRTDRGWRVAISPTVHSGTPMDRLTKATLWIAFLVLLSYFVFFYMDCAMDDDCHLVCPNPPRGICYIKRTPDLKL